MLEKQIQRDILAYLRKRNIFVAAVPNGAVLAGDAKARAMQMNALKASGLHKGFADLIAIKADGRVGFIEVKAEGGKLSDEQKDFADKCQGWGLPWAVCRSTPDVDETLKLWGWA